MAFRDELLGLLYNLERAGQECAKQFYLEAWNGNGRFVYDRIGRGTVEIDACCLSILGSIQPEPLQTYLMTAPDDGLMQRFQLAVWPDSTRDWHNVDRWPDKTAKDAVWDVFKRLDDLVPFAIGATPVDEGDVPCLRFSEEAQQEFDQWRESLEKRLRTEDLTPAIETVLAKYRSLVPSLALLIHCVDCPDGGPVGLTALIKACAWTEYLESHAHRIYSAKLAPAILSGRALAAKIKAGKLADRFTVRTIYQNGWSRLSTAELAQQGVNLLVEMDWLRAINEPASTVGGRPKTVYQINPQVLGTTP
jgi:putative DNA primase/helicase